MTRVSRAPLHKERLKELQDHLSYLISSLNSHSAIENFLDSFLTKEEKLMLTKRLVIYMMLKRGYGPSVIQAALHVSYETIRSYTNQFTYKDAQFQQTIELLIKRDKSKEFWQKVDSLLRPVELALNAKTNMKARAKLASGDWS